MCAQTHKSMSPSNYIRANLILHLFRVDIRQVLLSVNKIHEKLWGDDIINSLICIFISTVQEMSSNFQCSVRVFSFNLVYISTYIRNSNIDRIKMHNLKALWLTLDYIALKISTVPFNINIALDYCNGIWKLRSLWIEIELNLNRGILCPLDLGSDKKVVCWIVNVP